MDVLVCCMLDDLCRSVMFGVYVMCAQGLRLGRRPSIARSVCMCVGIAWCGDALNCFNIMVIRIILLNSSDVGAACMHPYPV